MMLEDLFTHQPTIKKHRAAPLLEARLRFLEHLRETGAKRQTLKTKASNMLRLICLVDLKQARRVSKSEIEAAAKEWSRPGLLRTHMTASPQTKAQFVSDALRWLRVLGWREAPEKPLLHPYTAEVAAFAAWAREERGYAESTIESCCRCADQFLMFLASSETPAGRRQHQ